MTAPEDSTAIVFTDTQGSVWGPAFEIGRDSAREAPAVIGRRPDPNR